ncbi:MAG: cytochrome b/b6 domain-containing protein, partial [Deltaproteobacteria bacterium]
MRVPNQGWKKIEVYPALLIYFTGKYGSLAMTRWTSTEERYGLVPIVLHWTMAVMIIVLFFLGEYMTGLEYTHPRYHLAPSLHKSLGLIVFALLVIRAAWTLINKKPAPVPMPDWERKTASVVQKLFYILLFGIAASVYLIPTADGG